MQRDNFRTPHQQLNRLAIFTWVCFKLHPQQELLMPIPKKRKKKGKKAALPIRSKACLFGGFWHGFDVSSEPHTKIQSQLGLFCGFQTSRIYFPPSQPQKEGLRLHPEF